MSIYAEHFALNFNSKYLVFSVYMFSTDSRFVLAFSTTELVMEIQYCMVYFARYSSYTNYRCGAGNLPNTTLQIYYDTFLVNIIDIG